jgi:triphosphatase
VAEVEIKYLVQDASLLDRLEQATEIDGFQVASSKTIQQTDEYWDTPDSAAAANKISLRRRHSNAEWLHTVKVGAVAGGFSRRVEIEEPAGESGLISWLQGLIDEGRLQLPFPPATLAPRVTVHNRRTALDLIHPNSAEVELALDRVTFQGPRGKAEELEIEGELVSGEESVLFELRDWLLAQDGLTASHASKYERALAILG